MYYANLLDQLRTAIREKRRGKLSKGVLLQQDNARVHTCKVSMDAVERNGYELIPHPAYSPDLAPSDFFLFPNLKKDIRGLLSGLKSSQVKILLFSGIQSIQQESHMKIHNLALTEHLQSKQF